MDKVRELAQALLDTVVEPSEGTVQEDIGWVDMPEVRALQIELNETLGKPIIVEVSGGVAECDDPRVTIIDHDNEEVGEDV